METDSRRFFAFNRLYWFATFKLQTTEQKIKFIESVVSYGLDHIEPNFSDDTSLKDAWNSVLPDLEFSWIQHEKGSNGTAIKQAKSDAKKVQEIQNKARIEEGKFDLRKLPKSEEPTQSAIVCLKEMGLTALAMSPHPLTCEQINWLVACLDTFGLTIAMNINNTIIDDGLQSFWEKECYREKTTFELILDSWNDRTESFNIWFSQTFPKLDGMKERLSYLDYCKSCRNYGRANVLKKLEQMNQNAKLSRNGNVFNLLESFIVRSINTNKNNKFHLPSFNDDISEMNKFPAGYDKGFGFDRYSPLFEESISKMNNSL